MCRAPFVPVGQPAHCSHPNSLGRERWQFHNERNSCMTTRNPFKILAFVLCRHPSGASQTPPFLPHLQQVACGRFCGLTDAFAGNSDFKKMIGWQRHAGWRTEEKNPVDPKVSHALLPSQETESAKKSACNRDRALLLDLSWLGS